MSSIVDVLDSTLKKFTRKCNKKKVLRLHQNHYFGKNNDTNEQLSKSLTCVLEVCGDKKVYNVLALASCRKMS